MMGSAFSSPYPVELGGVPQILVQNRDDLAGIDPEAGPFVLFAEIALVVDPPEEALTDVEGGTDEVDLFDLVFELSCVIASHLHQRIGTTNVAGLWAVVDVQCKYWLCITVKTIKSRH
jgi:hypothetical protein